ncbi:MAG: PPK2 family polyphosphate kinase [Mycobacteriales bacterium]
MDVRSLLRYDGTLPDPRATPGVKGGVKGGDKGGDKGKAKARRQVAEMAPELAQLQEQLFANGKLGGRQSLLLVLQGRDASGKDGTVKHVVGQVNPAGVRITSFGKPTKEELAHDFLWRITQALPRPGELGVFNRSHYEDVLVVRVHDLVPRAVWSRRYARINAWEKRLVAAGTPVVKVLLHLSPDEQKQRLLARLQDPTKHWKVGTADLPERRLWPAYDEAYRAVLERTSTDVAPWYVVPADRKWYRDWAVSSLLLESLRDLHLTWPTPEGMDLAAMEQQLLAQ